MPGVWEATAADGRGAETTLPGVPASLAGSETVEYRTTLADPRGSGDDVAVLVLAGLYAHATVATGGRLCGDGPVEHDTYFVPLRVPFVPDGPTTVRVTCHAPRDRFGGVHDTDRVPDGRSVPGVWWGAAVETGPLPYLERVSVRPERTDDGMSLRVMSSVLTSGPVSERLTYSVRPAGRSRGGGTMERKPVEADSAGRRTVEHSIPLRDPARWWPRGFGEQHRHVLRASLGDQERSVTFGVREVTFEDGTLLVNGRPVPVRGVNLLDADVSDIERARDLGATLVRMYAHVPPPAVYEACDEAGVLVWQDLPLAGPGEFDTDRGRDLAGALARQTARHPSIVTHAVHSEPATVAEGLGDGLLDRLRLRWRAHRAGYDDEPARAVAQALPDPVFPAVGGPGLGCDAAAYYPGWHYGTPESVERLLARYPAAIVAEYGAPAPGTGADEATASSDRPGATAETQARIVGAVTERLRRERVGAVAFCLRDASGSGFGVYTRDGEPKPARDALGQALEPVQAFLTDPSPGDSRALVVNDTPRRVRATLHWTAGGDGGEFDVTVDGLETWTGGPVTVPASAESVALELLGDSLRAENTYGL